MKKVFMAAVVFVGISGLVTALAWHHYRIAKRLVAHAVIVRDQSRSRFPGCESTAALARQALGDSRIGPNSTIMVIVTGDESTALEPQLLSSLIVPFSKRVLGPRDAVVQERDQFIKDTRAVCEKLPAKNISPIYLSIKRAVEHLRSHGCGNDSRCFVSAETDGEENADPQIRLALNGNTNRSLPIAIDNDGIAVTLCGIAETRGSTTDDRGRVTRATHSRDARRVERLRDVWLRLFTKPDYVGLQPYCPKE